MLQIKIALGKFSSSLSEASVIVTFTISRFQSCYMAKFLNKLPASDEIYSGLDHSESSL